MAYFGTVEQRNLHGLICIPVLPKSLAGIDIYIFFSFIHLVRFFWREGIILIIIDRIIIID